MSTKPDEPIKDPSPVSNIFQRMPSFVYSRLARGNANPKPWRRCQLCAISQAKAGVMLQCVGCSDNPMMPVYYCVSQAWSDSLAKFRDPTFYPFVPCWIPVFKALCIEGLRSPLVVDAMLDLFMAGLNRLRGVPIIMGNESHMGPLPTTTIIPVSNDIPFSASLALFGIWNSDGRVKLEDLVKQHVEKSKATAASKA
ncbi:hypothetical protein PIIN_09956 [Serendipita indica DSM 11827]|uniref:Uncharacterized protein n=1 Tax=Serendipita indica (strain DSM 11827) TaxID=1109443 RepID=G4TXB7_SERID|nr:hypothetical protein PIIN_09956 [Serendipita indica DSM 11827]